MRLPRDFDIEVYLDDEPLSVLSHGRFNDGPDAGLTIIHCTTATGTPTTSERISALSTLGSLLHIIETGSFYEDYDASVELLGAAQEAYDVLRRSIIGYPQ